MDTFIHDPDAVLDYVINWATWLGADTISTSTWTLSSTDIVTTDDSHTDTASTIWISGGVGNRKYTATNHIVTSLGREQDDSIMLIVHPS